MLLRSFVLLIASALPLRAETPLVVADILPVQGLVAMVMGDTGTPGLILPPGDSPHGHALRPSEARALDTADIVFRVGSELAPGLDRPMESLAGDAQVVALLEVPGTLLLEYREEMAFDMGDHDDHGHDHDHGDHADDPHAWLHPDNARLWLTHMADVLAKADPAQAETYRANARAARAEIDAAEADARQMLANVTGPFAVFHDAYQYFERAFDVPIMGAITASDATPPSPARLAALRDRVAEENVTCLFAEPQFNPRLVASLSDDPAFSVAVLDPLGADIAPGAGHYPALLRDMATRIAACAAE